MDDEERHINCEPEHSTDKRLNVIELTFSTGYTFKQTSSRSSSKLFAIYRALYIAFFNVSGTTFYSYELSLDEGNNNLYFVGS